MRPQGGIIGATVTPTTSAASGVWTLREAERFRRGGTWPKLPSLLDSVSGAAAAYSLRYTTNFYSGAVVGLTRSTDGAVRAFYPSELTDGTAATWSGGGNAFVSTWYDQSGNSRNATQSNVGLRPQLISSGSVVVLNGKPAIDFSASTLDKTLTATISTSTALTKVAVFSTQSRSSSYTKLFNIGADDPYFGYGYSTFTWESAGDWVLGDATMLANGYDGGQSARMVSRGSLFTSSRSVQNMWFSCISSSNAAAYVNRSQISYRVQKTGNTSTLTNATLYVGNHSDVYQQLNGLIQELVFWTSDKLSARTTIENDIGAYYGL